MKASIEGKRSLLLSRVFAVCKQALHSQIDLIDLNIVCLNIL